MSISYDDNNYTTGTSDRALSGATIPGQSGPGSNGNEEVLCIPQSSNITGTSPSNSLMSYPEHLLVGVLPLGRGAVGVFYSPSRLGNRTISAKKNLSCQIKKEII